MRLAQLKIDVNTAKLMRPHAHGLHVKSLVVLHETVTHDVDGIGDILSVERFLASINYGIHGMTDAEGNFAWAYGLGKAVFSHAGGVNQEAIGIEQVSDVPLLKTTAMRARAWDKRDAQIWATAAALAAIHHEHNIPLRYTDSRRPGVTSHWDVSRFHPESEGHTDCFPRHKGGYYPMLRVLELARRINADIYGGV